MKPLISVIIPTYQRPALLKRCLVQLAEQSLPPDQFEIIVVMDGEDSSTKELLWQLVTRYVHLNLQWRTLPLKSGPAAARNMGWRNSEGDLVVFTDDDTLPGKNWLEVFWQSFIEHKQQCIAFSGKTIVPIPDIPTDYEKNIAQLSTASFITANCACTRAALQKTGGFDEDFKMAWREDTALEISLLENNIPIVKVENAVVVHPVRKTRWGTSIREEKKNIYNALLFKRYRSVSAKGKISSPPAFYYLLAVLLIAGITFAWTNTVAMLACLTAWLFITLWFTRKRLAGTSTSRSHRAEMLVTSAIIPVLSVFWTLLGSIRFKTLFL